MAAEPSKFGDYRLETEFQDGHVVHTDTSGKSTWKRGRMIGRGASGSVWLQEREGEEEQLRVVKMLPVEFLPKLDSSQELLAFVRSKDHDRLFVKFLGWYKNEYDIFFVMEYIRDGDLHTYMLRDPETAKKNTEEISSQILQGLVFLHDEQICHHNLKPQNILIASIDPIWVKITDFGIAKQTDSTTARTGWGTDNYRAPEILGLLPPRLQRRRIIGYALDIWSLGSIIHELLTSQMPFLTIDEESDEESGEESSEEASPVSLVPRFNMASFSAFCLGAIEFPTGALEKSGVCEEGIAFVKSLLVSNPRDRPTAISALQNPWLLNWFKTLKNQFSGLGVDLELNSSEKDILIRQRYSTDILHLLPASLKENICPLLLEAVVKGYISVISMIIDSPSLDLVNFSRCYKEIFRVAVISGNAYIVKIFLRNMASIHLDINTTDNTGRTALQTAAERGYIDIVQLLLDSGADVNTELEEWRTSTDTTKSYLEIKGDVNAPISWQRSRTALQRAAKHGHIEIVKILLDHNADVNAETYESLTALQAAVWSGHIDIVKLLLENGADVNAKPGGDLIDSQKAAEICHIEVSNILQDCRVKVDISWERCRTALEAAAERGHIEIFKMLLDKKADVNATASRSSGRTALQAASEYSHIEIFKIILEKDVNVNAAGSDYGGTALTMAAGGGNIDIVLLLLLKGAQVNTLCTNITPLMAAAGGGHTKIAEMLLEYGAYLEDRGRDSLTALQKAIKAGHLGTVRLLLDKKAEVNCPRGVYGGLGLQIAAHYGHTNIAKLLLENGVDANYHAPFNGSTAMVIATRQRCIEISKLLFEYGATTPTIPVYDSEPELAIYSITTPNILLEHKGDFFEQLLHTDKRILVSAARHGYTGTVKLLLDYMPDVDITPQWRTKYKIDLALKVAAKQGHIEIVKILLDSKADVDFVEENGITSLMNEIPRGYTNIVNKFLNIEDGRTELHIPVISGQSDIVNLLLENMITALMHAVSFGNTDIVKVLLEKGANPNPPSGVEGSTNTYPNTQNKGTALHMSVIRGDFDIVNLLLEYKADVNAIDQYCITPLMYAAFRGHTDIAKILLDSGANVNATREARGLIQDLNILDGGTALHMAVIRGHSDVVKMLLENKADINIGHMTTQLYRRQLSEDNETGTFKILRSARSPSP